MPGLGTKSGTVNQIGVIANRPIAEASLEGYTFFANDVNGGTLYWCDGTTWVQITAGLRNITAGANVSVVTNPSTITISSTTAPLSIASATVLGGIKVGSGLSIDVNGVLSTTITSPLTTKGDLWGFSTVNASVPVGADGTVLTADSTQALGVKWGAVTSGASGAIEFFIFGDGVTIAAGVVGELIIPFACTITKVTMLADRTTDAVVDIWKSNYAGYPPNLTNTITASATPTLTSATKMQDSTLTGWTTSISAGDILRYNVNSCSAAQRILISLDVTA